MCPVISRAFLLPDFQVHVRSVVGDVGYPRLVEHPWAR